MNNLWKTITQWVKTHLNTFQMYTFLYWHTEHTVCAVFSHSVVLFATLGNSATLWDYSPQGLSVYGDSSGKNTGVSCHALLQGIFPTQGPNPSLQHYRWILYHLSHRGSPDIYVCVYLVTQSCTTLCNPMDCSPPGCSVCWDSPGKNTGMGCYALLHGNLPNWEIKPRSPILQADSLLSEPPRNPKHFGPHGTLS